MFHFDHTPLILPAAVEPVKWSPHTYGSIAPSRALVVNIQRTIRVVNGTHIERAPPEPIYAVRPPSTHTAPPTLFEVAYRPVIHCMHVLDEHERHHCMSYAYYGVSMWSELLGFRK